MSLDASALCTTNQPMPPTTSGRKSLQSQILAGLGNQNSYVSFHGLRWDIAGDRGGIQRTGSLCHGIETGYINRSFITSFNHVIKRLGEKGQIEIKDERLTNPYEALNHFPYHTCKLEIHQLRGKLLPSIADYIQQVSPPIDIEKMQLSKLRMTQYQRFIDAREMWKEIQENIILMLKHRHTDMRDDWLMFLARGSHLFGENKFGHPKLLVTFYDCLKGQETKTESENEIIGLVRRLVDLAFGKQHRELKDDCNKIAYFMEDQRGRLKSEFKHYLREKHKDLIISLPGHEEPEDTIYPDMEEIRYSKYLDKLLTTEIFGKCKCLKAM
jgi:hypothetical protein